MSRLQKSKISQSFSVLIFVLFLIVPAQAQYSGGTGEPNNPYQIATAQDLIALGNKPNDYDKHFIMTADIDLAGYVFDRAVIAPKDNKDKGPNFSGVLDGSNHTISNLNIQGYNKSIGLFGFINNAIITNLGLINISISGQSYIGGLVGQSFDSIIYNCYVTGYISGIETVGGLIGSKTNSTVSLSYSTGTVEGYKCIGGLIGGNYVNDSLIGKSNGLLIHCYSNATVKGTYAGGLVGINGWLRSSSVLHECAEIIQCYSTGEVTGNYYVGGLVGHNKEGYVNQCYSTGKINFDSSKDKSDIGGMVGRIDSGAIINSFWNVETSGLATSAGGIGKTTTEMYDPNIFINNGWDFVGETQNGTNEIWQIPQSGGYPELTFFNGYIPEQLTGLGTPDDPYLVSDANQLGAIIHNPFNNYRLLASIDLSGINWSTAIIPYFEGNFDGNHLTISNINIEGTGFTGLFGILFPKSEVKNTGLINININCLGNYTGGLVAYNRGTVTQCYVSGELRNNDYVGGLAGYNEGSINNCYSNTAVDSNNCAGGLIGINGYLGTVNKCYSTGKVPSIQIFDSYRGGLVGCAISRNPEITSSFWDKETSGQIFSRGGIGKTTTEMKTKNTFTNAGWDFAGETTNGTEDIWTICEGTNYPRFIWQISEGDLVCPDGIAMEDFDFFMDHWGDTNCDSNNNYCEGTDLDFSGTVNINDFEILIYNWLGENP